jgi:4-hydroxy-tetrahydrodipicolinate reductase
MRLLILGDGHLGRAIAAMASDRSVAATIAGRPLMGGHPVDVFEAVDVVVDASRADGVLANVDDALSAGARRFVIATTGWSTDRAAVERRLTATRAAAVVAPNLSLGVALFARLVEVAAASFGAVPDVDPYLLEWHRRSKADRPSGTALDLAARLAAHHPRMTDPADLEVVSIRAGASPGMHLVAFDAPGETVELRLTARDRSAYAAGALAAADWLVRASRGPGIHPIDPVVDELLARPAIAA